MYNSVSTLNFFYNNGYLEYILDNSLHKFQCNICSSKIKLATAKKELNYVFRQFFRTEKKSTIDRNINFHARTVASCTASFFQIKDPIPRQLKSGIIYKHILMRVMINWITSKNFWKIVPCYFMLRVATFSAILIHLIWSKTNT